VTRNARVSRFEDLEAWQKARELARAVYQASGQEPFARDFGLRDQIRRAAVSVVSNIAEGFEREGDREFRQVLAQAKGSVGEVRAQLYVALDVGYLTAGQAEQLAGLALSTARLISGLMRYRAQSELKGSKFRSEPTALGP